MYAVDTLQFEFMRIEFVCCVKCHDVSKGYRMIGRYW